MGGAEYNARKVALTAADTESLLATFGRYFGGRAEETLAQATYFASCTRPS